jgi:hypothetical protein
MQGKPLILLRYVHQTTANRRRLVGFTDARLPPWQVANISFI